MHTEREKRRENYGIALVFSINEEGKLICKNQGWVAGDLIMDYLEILTGRNVLSLLT